MGDYGANPNPNIDKIHQVAIGYKFVKRDDLKVDQFPTATSLVVYHLVKKIESTNLSVLVDPAQTPPV